VSTLPPATPLEVWFQDEMRLGQKNPHTRRWARRGSRPVATQDLRTTSAYLFGAICPERGAAAAVIMPRANTEAMQVHLDEIAGAVSPGAHALVLLDQAGWHTTPKLRIPANLSLLPLPPRAPELCTKWTRSGNPVENLWQFLRQTFLSNRVFETYDAILNAACHAWNAVRNAPERIMSIGRRKWARTGQC
jgi:hypothetical protein